MSVQFTNEHLSIVVKGEKMIDGKLYDKIKVDDSMWTIEDGTKLILTMEKQSDNIWKTVIQGDQEIDATKVENTKALDDFDPETQVRLILTS